MVHLPARYWIGEAQDYGRWLVRGNETQVNLRNRQRQFHGGLRTCGACRGIQTPGKQRHHHRGGDLESLHCVIRRRRETVYHNAATITLAPIIHARIIGILDAGSG